MRSFPPIAHPNNSDAPKGRNRTAGGVARRATVAAAVLALIAPIAHADRSAAATVTTKKAAATKVVKSPLPVMNVTDVKTGRQVALASTFDGKKPMLVWFWAPH